MKTIIFDFGNVIGFFDHYRTLEKLRPYTTLSAREMYTTLYDGPLEDQVERGEITPPEFLEQVRQLWRLGCDIEFLAQVAADIFTPNPEVCDMIPKLARRYRILLGSNTNAIHSDKYRLQFADVLGHFSALVLSHEVGVRKPDTAFFEHCHRLAEAAPAECVFVDDLPANIAAARSYGFHGVLYKPSEDLAGQLGALGVVVS
jgi:putative hydrolase of the HAD superfamily